MTIEPYPFQRKDLDTLKEAGYVALLNMQPGAGKTVTATYAAKESGAQVVLIIAPLNTHTTAWGRTVKDVAGQDVRRIGNSKKSEKEALFDLWMSAPGYYIVTPQLFTRLDISEWRPDMVICDEIHLLNQHGSKGGKQLIKLGEQAPMKLALSGTPTRRNWERNWVTMRFLWSDQYKRGQVAHSNFWLFCHDRMTYENVYTGQRDRDGKPKAVKKWMNEAEPGRLYNEAPCVIQHFRREACCEFHNNPPGFLQVEAPNVIEKTITLHPKQKKAIKELETQMLAWLDDQPLIVELPMILKQRIRQVVLGVPTLTYDEEGKVQVNFDDDCVSPVADEIENILEHLEVGEPLLVHLESQRFAEVLVRRLNKAGWTAAEFSGKTAKEREGFVKRFGKDIQVLVATTSSLANGTDGLQDVCSTEVFAELSVDDTALEQVEARLWRLGAKKQVQRFYLHDDLGISRGKLGEQLTKRLAINAANRRKV